MTTKTDLLPCPFCGLDVTDNEGCFPLNREGTRWEVRCGNPSCFAYDPCDESMQAAVARWNRRATAARDAEIEALRAEVEMLRDAFSDEDMTAGAHWFGRYVEQKRKAEQLAEEVEALRAEAERSERYAEQSERERLWAEACAERLAEALRKWWAEHRPVGWTEDQHRACPYVNLPTDTDKALAEALLRDQENNDA